MPHVAAAALIGLAVYGLARLAFNALVVRFWSASDLASIAEPLAVGLLISSAVSPPLAAALGRYPAQSGTLQAGGVTARLLLVGMGLALLVVAPGAAWVLHRGGWQESQALFAVAYGCLFALVSSIRALHFWSGRVVAYLVAEASSWAVFVTLVGSGLVWRSLVPMFAAWIAQPLVFITLSLWSHRDLLTSPRHVWSPPWRTLATLLSFGVANTMGSFPSMATPQLALLVVSSAGTRADVGYWATLVSLVSPIQLFPRALAITLFPRLSRERRGGEAPDPRGLDALTNAVGPPTFIVSVFATAIAPVILMTTAGVTSVAMSVAFALLVTAQAMTLVATPALSAGPSRDVIIPAVASVVGLMASVATWVVLGATAGLPGVATGVVAGTVVRTIWPFVASCRRGWLKPDHLGGLVAWLLLLLLMLVLSVTASWAALGAAVAVALWQVSRLARSRGCLRW